jgi:hypothetical protein
MQLHHLPGLLNPADDFTSGDKKDAEISTAWQQKLFRGRTVRRQRTGIQS